jgi:hypothetical protein
VLAEALDFLAAAEWKLSAAAQRLGCTTSQLTRLLKLSASALEVTNSNRSDLCLPPIK